MNVDAKIISAKEPQGYWFAVWDRTKYRFNNKRVRLFIIIVATFFLSFTLVTNMTRIDRERNARNAMFSSILFTIPEILLPDTKNETEGAKNSGSHSKKSYSGPQVIYRALVGIPPGTLAKAKLITGASDGPVRAEIVQDVVVRGERVIEAGSQILGNGNSTEERLFLRFEQLVKHDGTRLNIQAQALDGNDRIAGIKGNKVSTEFTKLAAGIGLNFVGGMSDGLQETEVKGGVAVKSNSTKNALLNGTTHAALDQSRDLISSFKEKAPRIEVEKGHLIFVIFDGSVNGIK